jgi:hypothetical protein
MYRIVRNLHLVFASFSLPFLIMYAVSAVQMSHSTWFDMKPVVRERQLQLPPGQSDARVMARAVMDSDASVRGEVANIQTNDAGLSLRIVVPGTVHDVRYNRESGLTQVKSSVAGVMGMLNRLHHWAGFWHETGAMKFWALAVVVVSAALLLLGLTGLYMWFTRRPERRVGLVLLGMNVVFAIAILTLLRRAGP